MSRSKPSSRENGRLSHGPATQAGKDRAKYNALRHGLLAQRAVVLEGESELQYNRLADAHYQRFQPQDEVEAEIVDEMASAKWRIRRLEAIETCLMNEAIQQSATGDSEAGIVAGFRSLAESKTLALLLRYDSHLKLAYQRSLRNLIQVQNSVPLPAPELEVPELEAPKQGATSSEDRPKPQPAAQPQSAPLHQHAGAAAAAPNEPIFMEPLRSAAPSDPASASVFAASSPFQPV